MSAADVLRAAVAAVRAADETAASNAALLARVREILPEAARAAEGVMVTIWEKDRRWEVDRSAYIAPGTLLLMHPDRLAPEEVPSIRFSPGPLREISRTEYSLLRRPSRPGSFLP
ncbi:hypothetical protein SEA_ALTADENA_54 [Arthrobacter phage Altadena]|uniref:Uncharacterized protein n=1 Tax=Arthrobacter phage Altadena TaxID=3059064 RepID=A0AA96KKM5_9CAUD|nr:hypothetical protein SEA_ALTADENA_54 [Arthrobacter phage Altadena]